MFKFKGSYSCWWWDGTETNKNTGGEVLVSKTEKEKKPKLDSDNSDNDYGMLSLPAMQASLSTAIKHVVIN